MRIRLIVFLLAVLGLALIGWATNRPAARADTIPWGELKCRYHPVPSCCAYYPDVPGCPQTPPKLHE